MRCFTGLLCIRTQPCFNGHPLASDFTYEAHTKSGLTIFYICVCETWDVCQDSLKQMATDHSMGTAVLHAASVLQQLPFRQYRPSTSNNRSRRQGHKQCDCWDMSRCKSILGTPMRRGCSEPGLWKLLRPCFA